MNKLSDCKSMLLFLFLIVPVVISSTNHRSKRFLIFPRTAPTRIQILSALGIPVDLDLETVTIGYVFKADFYIPDNASDFINPLADPFDLSTHIFDRRSIEETTPMKLADVSTTTESFDQHHGFDGEQNEKYERHNAEAEIVESGTESAREINGKIDDESLIVAPHNHEYNDDPMSSNAPQNTATSRWTLYKAFATIAESKGLAGKPCVMRSICESAHTSFDYSNGILGELMHIVMTPSTTHDDISDHSDLEYHHAERLGKEGAPCQYIFNDCETSLLEQFSGIYTPIIDLNK